MSEARKFRKKPVVIEAVQFFRDAKPWPEGVVGKGEFFDEPFCRTPEGDLHVSEGDWIVTGIRGERYPVKPDIFAATYEAVDGAPASSQEKP